MSVAQRNVWQRSQNLYLRADSFEFCVKLHLQDSTADLDALLLGEHGQAFFRVRLMTHLHLSLAWLTCICICFMLDAGISMCSMQAQSYLSTCYFATKVRCLQSSRRRYSYVLLRICQAMSVLGHESLSPEMPWQYPVS